MYSTKWCPYCHRAREYFKRHSFDYVEYDIEASAENLAKFRELGGRGVVRIGFSGISDSSSPAPVPRPGR